MRHVLMRVVSCALVLALGAGYAQADDAVARHQGKKYQATRNITVDLATGQLRKPNAQEIEELVTTLATLTRPPSEATASIAPAKGGHGMSLEGGFAGVVLARPNADGTTETRCVFSFEEGAEFLGLVAESSEQ